MLYVQQSLGPGEEILMGGRFHWMYTFNAVMWIVLGLTAGVAIGYGAIWWQVSAEIRQYYPGLPEELFGRAWAAVIKKHGGYLNLLWTIHPLLRFSILGMFILGLFLFAHMMIVKATTEIAVTSERLIYKRGLIARHVGELNIDRIESVVVHQGVLGRMLGYGLVCIRGMGVGEVILPPIELPIEFRKVIQEAKTMQEKGAKSSGREDFR